MIALVPATSVIVANAQPVRRPLKERIPEADLAKCYQLKNDHWENPFLIVLGTGVAIDNVTERGKYLSIRDTLSALENLPDLAWPYGRIVGVEENAFHGPSQSAEMDRTVKELTTALGKMGVQVMPFPSA
jgi:hypothetical protein